MERFNAISHVSTSTTLLFMLLLGMVGYITFTGNTQGMINNRLLSKFVGLA